MYSMLTRETGTGLYPKNVFVNRGNHETTDMNRVYGYEVSLLPAVLSRSPEGPRLTRCADERAGRGEQEVRRAGVQAV